MGKKLFFLACSLSFLLVAVHGARAAPTTAVLSGVSLNEVLIDPNSATANFDTDGSGTAEDVDEFVELTNQSAAAVDLSGWQLWDAGAGNWFTFPPGSVLQPGAYAVVLVGVQTGGALPTMGNPASLAFDAGRAATVFNNGTDNVVLLDPLQDAYVQFLYNGDTPDDPPAAYAGFPATAVRSGPLEDWGTDQDGHSVTRYPSGDSNVGVHSVVTPGGAPASPTAVTLASFDGASGAAGLLLTSIAGLLLLATILLVRGQRRS